VPATVTLNHAGERVGDPRRSTGWQVEIDGNVYAVSPEGFKTLGSSAEARAIFAACATDFRAFLDHWTFIPSGKPPMILGQNMWRSQETFAATTVEQPSVYYLKARQLGESTIACAYDGWRARFGPVNARVSILAQTDESAKEFLRWVVYGLEHLPEFMTLPIRALEHTATLDAGKHDKRRLRSYPASNAIRSGSFCHVHLDEWAAMTHPKQVWMAVEESIIPGGTCHALTTGVGGHDYTGDVWRAAKNGESRFHPLFIGALERDDRTPEWYEMKRRTTDAQTLRQELPLPRAGEKRNLIIVTSALRRAEPAVLAEVLPDDDDTALEVHVLPVESDNLSEPKPCVERGEDDRAEPGEPVARREQAVEFARSEHTLRQLVLLRALLPREAFARVRADEFVIDCRVQDAAQRAEDERLRAA